MCLDWNTICGADSCDVDINITVSGCVVGELILFELNSARLKMYDKINRKMGYLSTDLDK